jgi:hypothetical protein
MNVYMVCQADLLVCCLCVLLRLLQAVDAVRQLRELLREQVLQLAQQQGYTLRS